MNKIEKRLDKFEEEFIKFQSTQIAINQKIININNSNISTFESQAKMNANQSIITAELISRIMALEEKVKELESK